MEHPIIAAKPWAFGINDTSLLAWLICILYFVLAIICWRISAVSESRKRLLWAALAMSLVVLGLNKQLDLHQLIIEAVSNSFTGPTYDEFPIAEILSVGAIIVVGVALALGFKVKLATSYSLRWAYLALSVLLAAELFRFLPGAMSTFLAAHLFSEEEGLFHVHVIELIELVCLVAIGYFARLGYLREIEDADGEKE